MSRRPDVEHHGGGLTIHSTTTLREVYRALLVGISHARVSGLSDAPLRALVPLFAAAIREGEAMIDVAHNSSNVAAARDNKSVLDDALLSVAEAAALSGYSVAHMRRLARNSGLGRRIGNSWALRRSVVEDLKLKRRERSQDNGDKRTAIKPDRVPGVVRRGGGDSAAA